MAHPMRPAVVIALPELTRGTVPTGRAVAVAVHADAKPGAWLARPRRRARLRLARSAREPLETGARAVWQASPVNMAMRGALGLLARGAGPTREALATLGLDRVSTVKRAVVRFD